MLACARIGAVHSVVFGGFSPDRLAGRIEDCKSSVVITADEGLRGGRKVPLKANVDDACDKVARRQAAVIVVRRTGGEVDMKAGRDFWYDEMAKTVPADCPCEEMNAEDPLFILYTSGSTGKPKGVLHTTGGYLVYASITHQYVFDYHDGDIYWCTADVGWVTGHSYIVYGPLANGATTLMFEGVPNYPTTSRFWEVFDKHKVNIFYTAPTAIRALMQAGDDSGEEDLAQVAAPARLGRRADQPRSVGVVPPRRRRGPLPDRRHLVADRDRRHPDHAAARRDQLKPGSATLPFFGVKPVLVDADGKVLDGAGQRQPLHRRLLAGPDAHASTATTSASSTPTSRPIPASTSPATAAAATRTATTGSPAASTTSSTSPATAWAPPRSRARWSRIRRCRRPRSSAIRTTSRARASTPTSR